MVIDFCLDEFKNEVGELIERSAYARMMVAQAISEIDEEDELRGFYYASREWECAQSCRWLMRDGVACDVVEQCTPRDMNLLSDVCVDGDIQIRFIRRT